MPQHVLAGLRVSVVIDGAVLGIIDGLAAGRRWDTGRWSVRFFGCFSRGNGTGGPVPRTPWDLTLYACSSKVSGRQEAATARPAFPVSVSLGGYGAGNGKRVSERAPGRPKSGLCLTILKTPGNPAHQAAAVPENGSKINEGRTPASLILLERKWRVSPQFPCPASKADITSPRPKTPA